MKTKKKYVLIFTEKEDGNSTMTTKSDGYGAMEIIGILDFKRADIMAQIREEIKPDVIKRMVVE